MKPRLPRAVSRLLPQRLRSRAALRLPAPAPTALKATAGARLDLLRLAGLGSLPGSPTTTER